MSDEKHGIPAASIHGFIDAIRSVDPDAAEKIERVGRAMLTGSETDEEFLDMCKLLLRFGARDKAEDLLIRNCDERVVLEVLGGVPRRVLPFDAAIEAFKAQYAVVWELREAPHMLARSFTVTKTSATARDDVVDMLVRTGCEVQFGDDGRIHADVSIDDDPRAIPMVCTSGTWSIDDDHIGATWLRNKRAVAEAVSIASQWVASTRVALSRDDELVEAALRINFHAPDARLRETIARHFEAIERVIVGREALFHYDPSGDAAAFTQEGHVYFSSAFESLGPLCRAAMIIHECVHVFDARSGEPDIHVSEWDEPRFSAIPAELQVHNPSAYASFAAQVHHCALDWPREARFGAGMPTR